MKTNLALTISALLFLTACATPFTAETTRSLREGVGPGSLCYAIQIYRPGGYDYEEKAANFEVLMAEYKRRNPKISSKDLNRVAKGLVAVGMQEKHAACSWISRKVGETVGYGRSSKQWKSGNNSYFFTDHRNRVTFISV